MVIRTAPQITSANPTNDVYSVAKAYAVTGVGIAYDAGLLSPDTNVPELLGDEMPTDAVRAAAMLRWIS